VPDRDKTIKGKVLKVALLTTMISACLFFHQLVWERITLMSFCIGVFLSRFTDIKDGDYSLVALKISKQNIK